MAQTTYSLSVNLGDGNANSGNMTGCFNTNVYKSDEDAKIMHWLSPLEPRNRHQGVRTDRFDGVGDWLLETSEFWEWRQSEVAADKAVLFCSGDPGVGKTYLSSLVIDRLCDQEGVVVAGLYCDFLTQHDQTITNIMGAILKQLVGGGDIPNYVREAFQGAKKKFGGRGLRLPDVMKMLRITIDLLPQVFICIDALDECLPKHLPELLESLRDIVRESPKTRIFLTGRPHVNEDTQRYFSQVVVIPISPNTNDIRSYLDARLGRDCDPEAMNGDLQAEIVKVIVEKISHIFLLVSLSIDAILREVTIRQRRKKLEEMTSGNGLSDAYTATLARMKAQKGNRAILGLKTLMWVSHSERPLRAAELCHALGVEIGSRSEDPENVPAIRTLLASCLGLITVEASTSVVRLVHFTLQEHLSSVPTLFYSPHSTIAEVCLTYLNFGRVRDLSPTLRLAPSTTPFLKYASYYWGNHTIRDMTENVKRLALRLLEKFDKHIRAQLMLRNNHDKHRGPYFYGTKGPGGFTGLHGVAFLGIVGIVAALLEMEELDVNAIDSTGCAALTWAAMRGHEEVVKVLLGREDVSPDIPDTHYGRTPLLWAMKHEHSGVVKMLLERKDVNPNLADTYYGQTPLWWAAGYGQEGIVKMLLERQDVNPNTPDTYYGQTPLSWAAKNGHMGVVKLLLERGDINPDIADTEYGRTPLLWAIKREHEGVVKILLEHKDVNPNIADTRHGRNPLSWAVKNGNIGVLTMLLERPDVSPQLADTEYGQTTLSWAAEYGYAEVVKTLLERKDVNPNTIDTRFGGTPLLHAAVRGHEEVAKILLERQDVNPNTADTKYGLAPLSWAADRGRREIVKLLLERYDINPNTVDTRSGGTPLLHAAVRGHEEVAKMLLERRGVNPNKADTNYGRTPLSWAAKYGRDGVVKMLLERQDVNPNTVDTKYGLAPLSWAAERGHGGVVKLLLERLDVNPNTVDTKYGRTPLRWAAEHRHEGVVKMLLERQDIIPNTADP